MKPFFTLFFILLFQLNTQAQNYLVEMVTNLSINNGSNPRWFTEYNNSLYFFANDGINGHKIFSFSGNNIPTICPNVTGAAVFGDGTTSTNFKMAVLNGKLYLPILVLAIGRELYKYDGVAIPSIIMDINPGNGSGGPSFLLTHNNKLYFQANSPALGTELWVHDPITLTTQCLTDINPGALSSTVSSITVYNNKLYFAATNGNDTTFGNTGIELYSYDPAVNTVNLVADINPGNVGSNPTALMVANNKLYFVATDTSYGKELYEYDGNNVTRLTDVNPGPAQGVYTSDHSFPTYFNGKIYFAANEPNNDINLGVFDIASNATSIVYCSGVGISGTPRYFNVWDNKLIFSNYSDTAGIEIWATNGTNPPFQVWDVYPGALGGLPFSSNPKFFTVYDSCLYFNATNDTSSLEELFRLSIKKDTLINPNTLSDVQNSMDIQLAPNPVSDVLNVNISIPFDNMFSYQLTDITGRVIYQKGLQLYQKSTINHQINLSNIQTGHYFFILKDKNNRVLFTQKIVRQ